MLNLYNGNVVLDENGESRVQLPDYFEALNQDFRYQLTAMGSVTEPLHRRRSINDNRFKIAGGAPGLTVLPAGDKAFATTHMLKLILSS